MDNHPIPQDVTGFQFRLIGDMTIKQFAYLAAGIILAWICLSLPIFILLKLPFVVFFGGAGVILAFIPIGGRPADTMIFYFFKAVFSPTQYIYSSQNQPIVTEQPVTTIGKEPTKEEKHEKKDDKVHLDTPTDASSFEKLFGEKKDADEKPAPPEPTLETKLPEQTAPVPQVQPEENPQELSEKATTIAKELIEAQKEETTAHDQQEAQEAHEK